MRPRATCRRTQLFKLPDDVDDRTAAAILLKGCTTEFLVERCAKVQAGQTVLVHAAAGGVGHLAGRLAQGDRRDGDRHGRQRGQGGAGARGRAPIMSSSTSSEDIAARVREITGGKGVPVVLDGVGKATWEASLASAARRGLIVSYGNAGGAVDGVNLGVLARQGLAVRHAADAVRLLRHAGGAAGRHRRACSRCCDSGAITPEIGQTFALEDAADAHRALEAGETSGSTILLP